MKSLLRSLIILSTTLILTLSAVCSDAAGIPTTPGWRQIPNTDLQTQCPPNNFNNSGYDFFDYCRYVTEAWNGGAFDTKRNRLIIWGGGHANYSGNEIYALDLNTLTMQRLNDPGLPVVTAGQPEAIVNGTQPNSRHTYDGIAYMANIDRLFVYGGSLTYSGYASNGTWTFNFATNKWQNMNPSGDNPGYDYGDVSAYDPNSGKVFLHSNHYLFSYNFTANTWTRLTDNNPIDYHLSATLDPVRKKFVMVGAGRVYTYDVSAGSTYARTTLVTSGGDAIVSSSYPGLAYDSVRDRIVAWNGGDTVYSLNLDTGVWASVTYSGGPGTAVPTGTFDRWSYVPTLNAFVLVNMARQNAYSFRFSSSTPSGAQGAPAAPSDVRVQ